MSAAAESPSTLDVASMSKSQKLAALLILLGPDSAAELMKHMAESELAEVSAEIAKIPMITQELRQSILQEFNEVMVEASTGILGGVPVAQHALEKSVGLFRATNILSRISPGRSPSPALRQLAEMEPPQVANLLRGEQPQTIALVLSFLPADRGAKLLPHVPDDIRPQVIERLATLEPTSIDVAERLVEVLQHRAGQKRVRALNQTGGLQVAAELMNTLNRDLSKALLTALEEKNPEIGASIRQKMFTFEDLLLLDQAGLQKLLREIDMRDLSVALKTASEKLKSALLACLSKRAAETVKEEMAFASGVKAKDIEAAQQRIVEVVRRLETEGEIEIDASKGK